MRPVDPEQAISNLKKVSELFDLYFELSFFKVVNSDIPNGAQRFFEERQKRLERDFPAIVAVKPKPLS